MAVPPLLAVRANGLRAKKHVLMYNNCVLAVVPYPKSVCIVSAKPLSLLVCTHTDELFTNVEDGKALPCQPLHSLLIALCPAR